MHLVVVPTFNERDNIGRLLEEILMLSIEGLEILVVDDSSPDGTAQVVRESAEFGRRIFLFERKDKDGLGAAYRAGFAWAFARDYETISQMDADFSHDPKDLPRLIDAVKANADLAIGSRRVSGGGVVGWGPWRRFCSAGAMTASRFFLRLRTRDVTTGFRTWKRPLLEKINVLSIKSNGYAFQEEMLLEAEITGARVVELPVLFVDRRAGQSKLGFGDIVEFFVVLARLVVKRRHV